MKNNTVLIVDDEELIRELLARTFSMAGYAPKVAASAEEALGMVQHERIHVFFLDLNLPGMNGLDLCRALRVNNPMAICHAVTGYATLFELAECREAGFEDYFIKPVKKEALLDSAAHSFSKLARWCNW